MPGGKGKSIGGKAGSKDSAGKAQKSHSAKAGLQVSALLVLFIFHFFNSCSPYRDHPNARQSKAPEPAHLFAPPSFFSRLGIWVAFDLLLSMPYLQINCLFPALYLRGLVEPISNWFAVPMRSCQAFP